MRFVISTLSHRLHFMAANEPFVASVERFSKQHPIVWLLC
jgi:hypothetical protein